MHECPRCGNVCDCDMEDTWFEAYPEGCSHDCEDEVDDDLNPDIERCARCGQFFPEYDGEVVEEECAEVFYCYYCAVAVGIIEDV